MSLSAIKNLETALAAFDNTPEVDQRAAADLATRFAARVKVKFLGTSQEQYVVVMRASARRLPQDLQLLRDIVEFSEHDSIRTAAKEELNEQTRIGGDARRQMPSSLVI